jgi:hypothetical protein
MLRWVSPRIFARTSESSTFISFIVLAFFTLLPSGLFDPIWMVTASTREMNAAYQAMPISREHS